jgi:hypothetical protein
MRGAVAKRLRREVYKDMAVQTTYKVKNLQKYLTRFKKVLDEKTGKARVVKEGYFENRNIAICTGLRALYLKAKDSYKGRKTT